MARLTVNQRKQLAAERNSGTGYRTLSKKYGCNKATIKRWAAEGLKAHPKLAGIRGRGAKSGRGWRSRLQKAWGSIEQPTIDKLVSSLDQRIEDIKELGGAWRIPKAG